MLGASCISVSSGMLGGGGCFRGQIWPRQGRREEELAWAHLGFPQGVLPGSSIRGASRYSGAEVGFTHTQGATVRSSEGISLSHHESITQETESAMGFHPPNYIYTSQGASFLTLTSLSTPLSTFSHLISNPMKAKDSPVRG